MLTSHTGNFAPFELYNPEIQPWA